MSGAVPELRFTRDDGSDFPDWEERPFSEIATRAGEQFDPRKDNGKPRVIELEHLESGSGKILSSADIDGQISLKNQFRSGDVLFGKLRPYLRKFALPDFDGVCSSEIWVLRGRKGVSNSFLYALVQSPMFSQVVNISSGSKMPRADWKVIAGVDFPVPCQEEQEKISSAFSVADAKLAALREKADGLRQFKAGLMQRLFSQELRFTREDGSDYPEWEERTLETVCKLKSGDFVPASNIETEQKDDLFLCYGGNGLRGYVSSYNKDGTFPLIGRQGALCGNVHLVSGKFHATEHAVVAEPKEGIAVEWLFYQLKQMNLNQYATGVAQPGLAVGSLINLIVDVPHHDEQEKIAGALCALDAKIDAVTAQITHMEAFKKGLLQKMFV